MRALTAELSPERRLKMASEMFATARQVMRAGIQQELGPLAEGDLRVQMFLRLYGGEFAPERAARIVARIRKEAATPRSAASSSG